MHRLRSSPLPVVQWRDALRSPLDALPDAELLDRFARYADHPAFEALLRRHGPMVFGVCRRTLPDADADDAFQATFLVFMRKARSLHRGDRLGPWLFGVARRVAMKARSRAAHLAAYRTEATDMIPDATSSLQVPDWLPILDAELAALPAKYRDAIILCELQGVPRAEAAKTLGLREGTLSSRLARGRDMLRKRLLKHGTLLPAGGLGALFASTNCGRAAVPAPLLARTSDMTNVATGAASAGAVPVGAARLTDEVLKGMFLTNLRMAGGAFLALVLVTIGLAVTRPDASAEEKRVTKEATGAAKPEVRDAAPPKAVDAALSDRDALQGLWVVEKIEVSKQAKPDEVKQLQEAVGTMQFLVAGDVWWGMTGGRNGNVSPELVKLDPTKNPKWIDMGELTPDRAVDLNQRAIYELDGDKLRICLCGDTKTRPAEFSTEDNELVVMHFRRGKAAPSAGQKALVGSWSGESVTAKVTEGHPREYTPRAEVLDGYLFVSVPASNPQEHRSRWVGGKYTVDTTKNPKWVDVELVFPFDDEKATKLYGSYERMDGRLKLALGTKRATRPLEFKSGDDVLHFDLKVSKATPGEVHGVVEKVVRESVAKPKNVPAPMPKAADKPVPGPNKP